MKTSELLAAYDILRRRGINEDDLHDAVIKILPRLPHVENVLSYLARVAFTTRLKRNPIPFVRDLSLLCPSPESTRRQQEDIEFVRRVIEHLPARERRVVELRYFADMRCDVIARQLDSSPNAIRSVLFRAQKRLAGSLAYINEAH